MLFNICINNNIEACILIIQKSLNQFTSNNMKQISSFLIHFQKRKTVLLILLSFAFTTSNTFAQTLDQQAREKITILNNLITDATNKGISVEKEKMTVRTAEVFLKFANWDEANVPINTLFFAKVYSYKNNATEMATNLPNFERTDVIAMLDEATATLTQLNSGQIYRKPIPIVDWTKITHNGDQLTFNGKPVFTSDYTWKPNVTELDEYFGNEDGFYIDHNQVKDASGTINPWTLSSLNAKATGSLGSIFLGNKNVPDWAETKYGPGFKMRTDTYTAYDIDNPGAKELTGLLLKGTVPITAGKKFSELGYLLCNEPHFFTKAGAWATGPVSNYTIAKFRTWLSTKYASIADLNTSWGASFTSFDNVAITIPIDGNLQGTPKWYDWVLFNQIRVTDWYTYLKTEIRKYDPASKVHIKIMPNLWTDNWRDHGIDLEALSRMSDILGNDAGAQFTHMWGAAPEWEANYAFEWRELCMGYDFMKSVSPEKIIYNSEGHFITTSNSCDLYLSPNYIRAVYWLAHLTGMNAIQSWFWPRAADGSISTTSAESYAGTSNNQPRVTNEIHSTTMDLNSYSEEITAFQRQKKPIRIFYSKTSAINKTKHMDDVYELYKSVYFNGLPIGFASKDIIINNNNRDWEAILIYKTEFVTQAEISALQTYLNNGGTVIIDAVSLKKNEYGKALPALTAGTGKLITSTTLAEMGTKAMEVVSAKNLMPEVSLSETNTGGAKGCIWRVIKNSTGENVLSVVNVGKTEATLDIKYTGATAGTSCRDLLKGVLVTSKPKLKPNGVLFMSVKDSIDTFSTTSPTNPNNTEKSTLASIYPTIVTSDLVVNFTDQQRKVEMRVYDMSGSLILNENFTGVKKITKNIDHISAGHYMVRLITENSSQLLDFIKY